MTSGLLKLISTGWVVMFLDSHHTEFIFRSEFDLLDVELLFFISILKIFKSLHKIWQRVTDTTIFGKTFGKFFRSYSELLFKFGAKSFQDYVSQGITHPVSYGDLVYKFWMVKGEANFCNGSG